MMRAEPRPKPVDLLVLLVLLPPLPYGSAEPGVDRDKLLTLLL